MRAPRRSGRRDRLRYVAVFALFGIASTLLALDLDVAGWAVLLCGLALLPWSGG